MTRLTIVSIRLAARGPACGEDTIVAGHATRGNASMVHGECCKAGRRGMAEATVAAGWNMISWFSRSSGAAIMATDTGPNCRTVIHINGRKATSNMATFTGIRGENMITRLSWSTATPIVATDAGA